jgi:hypothetical protein
LILNHRCPFPILFGLPLDSLPTNVYDTFEGLPFLRQIGTSAHLVTRSQ